MHMDNIGIFNQEESDDKQHRYVLGVDQSRESNQNKHDNTKLVMEFEKMINEDEKLREFAQG